MLSYQYAYLIGSLITVPLWLYLYSARPDFRRKMMLLSLATVILAPTNILYYNSYWRPEFIFNIYNFGIESVIVCFTYGGICGVLYQFAANKKVSEKTLYSDRIGMKYFSLSILAGVVAILALEVLTDLNVIYTTTTGLFLSGILFTYIRRDLFMPSIYGGVLSTLVSMTVYWLLLIMYPEFFNRFWITSNLSDIKILWIPFEEYYFHFALGYCLTGMYELKNGKEYLDQ